MLTKYDSLLSHVFKNENKQKYIEFLIYHIILSIYKLFSILT